VAPPLSLHPIPIGAVVAPRLRARCSLSAPPLIPARILPTSAAPLLPHWCPLASPPPLPHLSFPLLPPRLLDVVHKIILDHASPRPSAPLHTPYRHRLRRRRTELPRHWSICRRWMFRRQICSPATSSVEIRSVATGIGVDREESWRGRVAAAATIEGVLRTS
jgi:hypothetical protein